MFRHFAFLLRAVPFCFSLAWAQKDLTPGTKPFVDFDERSLAFLHVRVINATGSAAQENQTILIENGTMAPGEQADLAVVEGNPATQISDCEKVKYVFKEGIAYDSAKLIDSVRGQLSIH